MFKRSVHFRKSRAAAKCTFFPLTPHRFNEMGQWRRQALGIRRSEYSLSSRAPGTRNRFHEGAVHVTRGTGAFAWKWQHHQQGHLPNLRPAGQTPPIRAGSAAWPDSWDAEFAAEVLAMSEAAIRESVLQNLTQVIFEETQRDGYELRRLDFEGKPLTEFPEPDVIRMFVLEEDTMRERVLQRIVEDLFRFSVTSDDRLQLRNYANIADYIVDRVEVCREPADHSVTPAVKEVLARHPQQPVLGFVHALPASRWGDDPLLDHWERLYRHEWQFGNAVYTPRSREKTQGNLTWLRLEEEDRARQAFDASVVSGEAKAAHEAKIREAAEIDERY